MNRPLPTRLAVGLSFILLPNCLMLFCEFLLIKKNFLINRGQGQRKKDRS
ncbi:hypothetical protein HMPREF9148_01881 [Prevotella sp. F0091]|nr:hypothetical protein HMPREF9148_01881 [Prevotella sp. F0091]